MEMFEGKSAASRVSIKNEGFLIDEDRSMIDGGGKRWKSREGAKSLVAARTMAREVQRLATKSSMGNPMSFAI